MVGWLAPQSRDSLHLPGTDSWLPVNFVLPNERALVSQLVRVCVRWCLWVYANVLPYQRSTQRGLYNAGPSPRPGFSRVGLFSALGWLPWLAGQVVDTFMNSTDWPCCVAFVAVCWPVTATAGQQQLQLGIQCCYQQQLQCLCQYGSKFCKALALIWGFISDSVQR